MNVKATWKPGFDDLKEPGDFMFYTNQADEITGILFKCPCGGGECAGVDFDSHKSESPKWHWNGSKESPTLTPSIQRNDSCRWHGYLTDGEFRSC